MKHNPGISSHILTWLKALGFQCLQSGDGYTDFMRYREVPDTDPDLDIMRDDQLTFIEDEGRWYGDTRLTDRNGDYLAHNDDSPSANNPYDIVRWLDAVVLELEQPMTRDPINDPENADLSEAHSCRACHQLIRPGDEHIYDEWFWHGTCLPVAWLDAAIAAEQAPPLDTCADCGTTADLWRPFRSPNLYCTTCIPDPTATRNL